jgi:hypothetical protein
MLAWMLAAWVLAALPAWARAEESLDDRRARLEAFSPAQKQEIFEHEQKFRNLPRAEQDRLGRLNRELEDDPQGPELRRVMQRYYDWLKTLPTYQRAQLLELPAEERVKRIQVLQAEQARKTGKGAAWGELARREWRNSDLPGTPKRPPKRLDPADMEGLFTWMDAYAKSHSSQILEKLPDQHRKRVKQELESATDPVRRQELIGWIWLWWQLDNRGRQFSISDEELADLRSKLSPATRKRLQSLPAAEQWRAVSGLFTSFMLRQYSGRHAGVPIHSATEEELARFFEHELKPEDRDMLLNLPGEEMQRALWRRYISWKLRQLPPLSPSRDNRSGRAEPGPRAQDAPWQPGPSELPQRGASGRKQEQRPSDKPASTGAAPSGRTSSEERPDKKPKDKPPPRVRDAKKSPPADASD